MASISDSSTNRLKGFVCGSLIDDLPIVKSEKIKLR